MPFLYLLEGIAIGFLLATPIGAVGILCIRRTLASGKRQGFLTGLGGASADIIFATVAAFGIKLISDFVVAEQHRIRLVGGILLLLMGFFTMRSRPAAAIDTDNVVQQTRTYISTLLLALTNPLVMFGFGAIMSAIGVGRLVDDYGSLTMLVAGVFLGSFLWFASITFVVDKYRNRITLKGISVVNRIAGVLLIVFGGIALWSGVRGLL
jgi:threonine/homoserine/homoserine lactone efflux protein